MGEDVRLSGKPGEGDTIFALSSAQGRAGVAVVRVSGPRAGACVARIAGSCPPPRLAALRTLRTPGDGAQIDRGLVLWFPGPASFTGEDAAEFHVHGGPAVCAALLNALDGLEGARPAGPGEFTRRAFDGGKLDLVEVEGLADLIAAETEGQRRQALRQAGGAVSRQLEAWRRRLTRELAYFEAQIDFADEADVPGDLMVAARRRIGEVADEIGAQLGDARRGERMRDGVRVAIVGAPNAGKSSLLNWLAQRDVAIVAQSPGTTRDVLEVALDLGGVPVLLADTAGLREGGDEVEAEGIRRGRDWAAQADVTVWLRAVDGDEAALPAPEGGDVIPVVSKADLIAPGEPGPTGAGDLAISTVSGAGLNKLVGEIGARARVLAGSGESAVVTRARQRAALEMCRERLQAALAQDDDFPELAAEDIRAALDALGRLTGRVDVEALLDVIFADFCIGK